LSDVWGMETEFKQEPYLYKLSSLYREDYVPGFEPEPTSASELPEIEKFAENLPKVSLKFGLARDPYLN